MEKKKKTYKKEKIEISTKHLKTRILVFFLAVIIALGGFGFGIYLLVNDKKAKEGWNSYSLNRYIDAKYMGYEENIYLKYYLTDNTKSVNKKVTSLLVDSSKEIYSLIDPRLNQNYKNNGIGYINSHLDEKIEIKKELYDILFDAKDKTYRENSSYSIFSGIINDHWKYYISKEGTDTNDGFSNFFNTVTSYIKDLSNFNLELVQEEDKYYATLSISSKLRDFFAENKIDDAQILDLNSLFYSYYLDYVYSKFKEANLIKGYLYTHTGEMIYMYDNFSSSNDIFVYDAIDYNDPFVIGSINNYQSSYVSYIRTFPIYHEYEGQYALKRFEGMNTWNSRSLYYDYRLGYSQNIIKSSLLVDEDISGKLVDLSFKNLNIINSSLDNYSSLSSSIIGVALKKEENEVVYVHNTRDLYHDFSSENGESYSYIQKTI